MKTSSLYAACQSMKLDRRISPLLRMTRSRGGRSWDQRHCSSSSGAIRGRLEFGNRQGNLKFVARFQNGSDEYTKLKAQTSGTAVVTLAFDANNSLQLTWQKITYSVVEIAETDFSRLLDWARRDRWAELAEPDRPEHPPRRYLVEADGVMLEPLEYTDGRLPQSREEQQAAFEERHREDAKAQVEWEAEARRDYESRRDSVADT